MTDFFESAFHEPMTRRRLIKGIAAAGAATWAANSATGQALAAAEDHILKNDFAHFRAIAPSSADALQVPDGYSADILIAWGDEFAPGMTFGYNCDYSGFYGLEGKSNEGLLWVNHEYVIPFFTSDWTASQDPTWDPRTTHRELMEREKREVGGSILHVRRASNGKWNVVEGSRFSRRFTAAGPAVPYDGPVAGTSLAPSTGSSLGTLANCSGAHTPWGTVLTCEENHQSFGLQRRMPFQLGWIKVSGTNAEEVNFYVGEPGTNVDRQRVGDSGRSTATSPKSTPTRGRPSSTRRSAASTTRTWRSGLRGTAASSPTPETTPRRRTACSSSSSRPESGAKG